jgi:uncharacterized membrane protein
MQQANTSQQPDTSAQQQPDLPEVGFLVAAFTDENAADQALDAMKQARKQRQFYWEVAAVIRQDAQGKVQYHETGNMSAGEGAGIGALVGGVLGTLLGPAGVALGVGAGAAIGAAYAHADGGFKKGTLQTVGTALRPGTSAVAVITSLDFLEAVQERVPIEDIRTSVSNLAAALSVRLAENKDVAIGFLLTEDGIAIKEIAADEDSTEVVGAVITAGGVVAGAAVATADGSANQVGAATDAGAVVETGVVTDAGEKTPPAAGAAPAAPAPAA